MCHSHIHWIMEAAHSSAHLFIVTTSAKSTPNQLEQGEHDPQRKESQTDEARKRGMRLITNATVNVIMQDQVLREHFAPAVQPPEQFPSSSEPP
jgi:hypothetical protein